MSMPSAAEQKRARDIRLGKVRENRVALTSGVEPPAPLSSTPVVIPIRDVNKDVRERMEALTQEIKALRERARALERDIAAVVPLEMKRVTTIRNIIKEVSFFYKVTATEMYSHRRHHQAVRARHVAMYLAKALTVHSLPEIGRRFGGRDHTTILHAWDSISRKLVADGDLRREIEILSKTILGDNHVETEH